MRIAFTGGNSGGHFFPIIAVAEKINDIADEEKLLRPSLYYLSNTPYNRKLLFENDIKFYPIHAGKLRLNTDLRGHLLNFLDLWKTIFGFFRAILTLFFIYPDVLFGKGGGASFPAILAARILRIPIVIHESDSYPGRTNVWAGKFANKVAVSYEEAGTYFAGEKVAVTGQPVRKAIARPLKEGAFEYLHLEKDTPVILVLGGSQGAQLINDVVLNSLAGLVEHYQVIHQVGRNNIAETEALSSVILEKTKHKSRYHPFGFLDDLAIRMSAGAANLVVSRAGSTIFEIAAWGLPSVVIPITDSHGDHQRKNAFNYARAKACTVIEEKNLTPHVLTNEIERILKNKSLMESMASAAKSFSSPEAATSIARQLINIGMKHEQ